MRKYMLYGGVAGYGISTISYAVKKFKGAMKLSQHNNLLEMYKPGIGTDLIYPVDAGKPNDTSDRWAFNPGFTQNPTPVDKALWAESEKMLRNLQGGFR